MLLHQRTIRAVAIVALMAAMMCGCAGESPQLPPPVTGSVAASRPAQECAGEARGGDLQPDGGARPEQARQPCVRPETAAKIAALATQPENVVSSQPPADAAVTISFEPNEVSLSSVNRKKLISIFEKHRAKGLKEIRILAGRGGNGNPFERMVVSQKRIRLVREILPKGMVLEAEYDLTENDDTLRVELVGDHSNLE